MKFSYDLKKQIFPRLKLLILICAAYYLATWFTGCPVKYFLGISCPGCGMTRAWLCIFHLDFAGAFTYHPLFWTVPFMAAAFLFDDKIDFTKYRWLLVLTAVLFFVVYFVRLLLLPGNIVVWEPENGAIFRYLKKIYDLFVSLTHKIGL
ncbi:MAG: DUF2752 domain-containing protein [Oliverpabstia sp.]|nr:DUF2752 domain-containing protein [Oliverpabstia sp.]